MTSLNTVVSAKDIKVNCVSLDWKSSITFLRFESKGISLTLDLLSDELDSWPLDTLSMNGWVSDMWGKGYMHSSNCRQETGDELSNAVVGGRAR